MAFDYLPLVTRVREVAAGAGSVRVVATESRPRAYDAGAAQEAARAIVGPGIEVIIDDRAHPARSLSERSTIKFIDLGISIRIEWPVPHELLDTARDEMRASAWSYEEELRRALQHQGNLTATSAGALTYVRSGCFDRYAGAKLEREDFPARRYSLISRYRCFLDAVA